MLFEENKAQKDLIDSVVAQYALAVQVTEGFCTIEIVEVITGVLFKASSHINMVKCRMGLG